jgi:hypothetical protein
MKLARHVRDALTEYYRDWVPTRAQELKQDNPARSKKDCWRAAQKEWHELVRRHKHELMGMR